MLHLIKKRQGIFQGLSILMLIACFTQNTIAQTIDVREDVDCSILRLYLSEPGNSDPSCNHLWEIKNAAGQVALTSTSPEPAFSLLNLNTYLFSNITVRHVVSCPNGTNSALEQSYDIQTKGIFVGAENNPTQVFSFLTTSSILNHQQPVFNNQLTFNNVNLYVSSILNIDVPITTDVFFNTVKGYMGPDAGINVSGRLRVNSNSGFVNHCNKAWRGIEVTGFLQFNDSRLEGAVYAVRPRTSSVANLVRATLQSNFVGVMANENYTEVISDCTFSGGPLPPKGITSIAEVSGFSGTAFNQSWAGVYVSGQSFFNNGDGSLGNRFQDLYNGYFIFNSNASISGASFTNILTPPSGASNQFGGHGIYFRHTDNTETFRNFKAFDNRFSNGRYGIRVLSQNQSASKRTVVDIFNNVIDALQLGISLEQNGNGRFHYSSVRGNTLTQIRATGINFNAGTGLLYGETLIQDNLISFSTLAAEATNITGIFLFGNTDMHNELRALNNRINGGLTGAQGNSRGILLQSLIKRVVVSGNQVQNTSQAIFLNNTNEITVSGNLCTANAIPALLTTSTGLSMVLSPDCIITDNTFENLSRGMYFENNCQSDNNIRCNTMRQTLVGLWLSADAIVGQQYETGNRWDDPGFGNGSLLGARYDGGAPALSLFRTAQGAFTVEYPQSIQGPLGWFVPGNISGCKGGNGDFSGGAAGRNAETGASFALYPNPAAHTCTLQLDTPVEESATAWVNVFNQLGATVYTSAIQAGSEQVTLDLNRLPNGTYRVVVFKNGQLQYNTALVIQK